LLLPFLYLLFVYNKTEIAVLLFAAIALSDTLDGLLQGLMTPKNKDRSFC